MSTVTDPVADGTFEPSTDPVAAPVGRVHLRPRGWFARAILGREGQPGWAHPALLVLLAATAVLYLWNLTASGYANDFYAAAVKAGTQSLKAWLFGSLDAGNSITVDKPPAFLWVTVAFARVFGFSSFSLLAPQALMGVGTVALVHAAVRRISGPVAGLLAGTAVAATPVAALMFRFDNPDALLTLLLALACYATLRAVQGGRRGGLGFLVLAGVAVGLAFLTKMGEALLFLPGLGLAYLVAAQPRLLLRLRNLLIAGAAVVVSAAWYVALVDLWPAASRPYIGGSTDNSLLQLALGYNGFGRLTGGDGNPGGGGFGGGGAGPGFGGATGLLRMFSTEFAGEIAWLLPTALFALAVGLVFTWRRPRTDPTRAALIAWGGCLLVSTVVFSYMSGIIHPYYTVVLAPPIAALIATAGRVLWLRRGGIVARCLLAVMTAGTSLWGVRLMSSLAPGWFGRTASVATIAASLGAAAVLLVPPRAWRRAALTTTAVAVAVGLIAAGTPGAAFAVATAANAHGGAVPASGPAGAAGARPAGFPQSGDRGRGGDVPDRAGDDGLPGAPGEAPVGPPGLPGEFPGGPGEFPGGSGGLPGGPGGLGEPMGVDNAVIALLNATSSTWSAAVIGSQSAAAYELSTDTAVMAIGGFSGSDPSPTLAQFQQYVRDGRIAFFIVGGGFGGFGRLGGGFGPGGGPQGTQRVSSQITAWVQQNFTATTVGNVTVYRLTAG